MFQEPYMENCEQSIDFKRKVLFLMAICMCCLSEITVTMIINF